jgi:hypothetical protein
MATTYPQVRGADLKFHALDSKGAPLCGLAQRRVVAALPMAYKPAHQRACPACNERIAARR